MNLRTNCSIGKTICAVKLETLVRFLILLIIIFLLQDPLEIPAAVQSPAGQQGNQSASRSGDEDPSYVGSQVCASCHRDIYNEYSRTSMGRSMESITPEILQKLNLPNSFVDPKLNRKYQVYSKDGKLFESEFQTDAEGKDVFRETEELRWIIGSGTHAFGSIAQRGDYLFEAPLTLYTKPMTWGLSPGYEFADYGFSRPLLAGCVFCHSGRSHPVSDTNGQYEHEPFSELAIGCEKCHGPGSAHILAVTSGKKLNESNVGIVNPARLTSDLANNICMTCHEIGDQRVLQQGKSYQDIRPGVPLDETLSILMVPPDPKSPPQTDHLQHYYSMTLSKCYRASGGRLSCITCHDPHIQPTEEEAPSFYNKRCLTCHTEQSCGLPLKARAQENPVDNCIGCHMQKRDVKFIAHIALTNHRIVARPDEALPDVMFKQTTAALPDLIHLDPAPGKQDTPPSLLTLLQAYGELTTYKPEYVDAYLKVLDQLSRTEPEKSLVQAALGSRDLKNGRTADAVEHFRHSLQIGPAQATVYADLANALESLGHADEAVVTQQKAIEQDPYNPILQKTLVLMFIHQHRYGEAQTGLERYLETFPQDSFMRNLLARSKGEAAQK